MPFLSSIRAPKRAAGLAVLTGLLVVGPLSTAAAATSTGVSYLGATVSGSSVTASATVTSSAPNTVEVLKICVRDASGKNLDYPATTNASLSTRGTWWSKTATFPAGTYSYFVCTRDDGNWAKVGSTKTFTVGGSAVASTPSSGGGSGSSSGSGMPVGNLSGWKQTFTDDFTTPVSQGGFPGPYASKWQSYTGFPTNGGGGDYNQNIISAHDGVLDINVKPQNGRPQAAAPIPLVNGKWGGQTYGRYSVRMKANGSRGYGVAFLLWSDTNNWSDGEVDFPESGLNDVVRGFNHCVGNPSKNCSWAFTDAKYSDWHTYTIEWRPDRVTFLLDGKVVGNDTSSVPKKPLHWVLQVTVPEPSYAASTSDHVLLDWATVYSMA